MLVERHGGEVPRSFAELESLPGVGHKTASVVLAIAFRMPTFPVDTHIHRRVTMHSLLEGLDPADMRILHGSALVQPERSWCAPRNAAWCPTLHDLAWLPDAVSRMMMAMQATLWSAICRLAQRWGMTNGRTVEQTEADLKLLWPEAWPVVSCVMACASSCAQQCFIYG